MHRARDNHELNWLAGTRSQNLLSATGNQFLYMATYVFIGKCAGREPQRWEYLRRYDVLVESREINLLSFNTDGHFACMLLVTLVHYAPLWVLHSSPCDSWSIVISMPPWCRNGSPLSHDWSLYTPSLRWNMKKCWRDYKSATGSNTDGW